MKAQAWIGKTAYENNWDSANHWLKLAAKQNHLESQLLLMRNTDIDSNYWRKKAAEQGDLYAQWELGASYSIDTYGPKDYKKTIYWYKKAAEQGDLYAQRDLGGMYLAGIGVKKDIDKAIYWLTKAATQIKNDSFDAYPAYLLGLHYQYGEEFGFIDLKKAIYWFEKSIEQGWTSAYSDLGKMAEEGIGMEKNIDKALEYYKKGMESGDDKSKKNYIRLNNINENKTDI